MVLTTSDIHDGATSENLHTATIINLLQRFGIKELARTGSVAMRRSKKAE